MDNDPILNIQSKPTVTAYSSFHYIYALAIWSFFTRYPNRLATNCIDLLTIQIQNRQFINSLPYRIRTDSFERIYFTSPSPILGAYILFSFGRLGRLVYLYVDRRGIKPILAAFLFYCLRKIQGFQVGTALFFGVLWSCEYYWIDRPGAPGCASIFFKFLSAFYILSSSPLIGLFLFQFGSSALFIRTFYLNNIPAYCFRTVCTLCWSKTEDRSQKSKEVDTHLPLPSPPLSPFCLSLFYPATHPFCF